MNFSELVVDYEFWGLIIGIFSIVINIVQALKNKSLKNEITNIKKIKVAQSSKSQSHLGSGDNFLSEGNIDVKKG